MWNYEKVFAISYYHNLSNPSVRSKILKTLDNIKPHLSLYEFHEHSYKELAIIFRYYNLISDLNISVRDCPVKRHWSLQFPLAELLVSLLYM